MTAIRSEIRRLTRDGAPPFQCPVTVESINQVSASYARVTVAGPGLADYLDVLPADAFKLALPPDGSGTVEFPKRGAAGLPYWPDGARYPALRAFTVHRFDAARSRLEFDVLRHPGLAMSWLGRAAVGDLVGIAGMRHEFHAGEEVARHVIVGDASALPAVSAIVAALPPGTAASVYLAFGDDSDRALVPARDGVDVHLVAGASPVGAGSALARAVRAGEQAGGRVQAWLGAEAGVVRELRRFAVAELGVAREDLHAAAYWRSGVDSTRVDAEYLDRYGRAAASGADVSDPDTRETVELDA